MQKFSRHHKLGSGTTPVSDLIKLHIPEAFVARILQNYELQLKIPISNPHDGTFSVTGFPPIQSTNFSITI